MPRLFNNLQAHSQPTSDLANNRQLAAYPSPPFASFGHERHLCPFGVLSVWTNSSQQTRKKDQVT